MVSSKEVRCRQKAHSDYWLYIVVVRFDTSHGSYFSVVNKGLYLNWEQMKVVMQPYEDWLADHGVKRNDPNTPEGYNNGDYYISAGTDWLTFLFHKAEDAMLFRLTWGGYCPGPDEDYPTELL